MACQPAKRTALLRKVTNRRKLSRISLEARRWRSLLTKRRIDTILARTGRTLRLRQLELQSEDPDHLGAITPVHYLEGVPLNDIPDKNLEDAKEYTLNCWQLVHRFQLFRKVAGALISIGYRQSPSGGISRTR